MYIATLGKLEEWSNISVKQGVFSGLPLKRKGSWMATISGLSVLRFENKERNTRFLPQQLC
jgi:hypothetical protein